VLAEQGIEYRKPYNTRHTVTAIWANSVCSNPLAA
jgi:isopentenyldiphosphate isomerase